MRSNRYFDVFDPRVGYGDASFAEFNKANNDLIIKKMKEFSEKFASAIKKFKKSYAKKKDFQRSSAFKSRKNLGANVAERAASQNLSFQGMPFQSTASEFYNMQYPTPMTDAYPYQGPREKMELELEIKREKMELELEIIEEQKERELEIYRGLTEQRINMIDQEMDALKALAALDEKLTNKMFKMKIKSLQLQSEFFKATHDLMLFDAENFNDLYAASTMKSLAQISMSYAKLYALMGAAEIARGNLASGAALIGIAVGLGALSANLFHDAGKLEKAVSERQAKREELKPPQLTLSDYDSEDEDELTTVSSGTVKKTTTVNVHIHGDYIGESVYIQETLIPLINDAVVNRDTKLVATSTV